MPKSFESCAEIIHVWWHARRHLLDLSECNRHTHTHTHTHMLHLYISDDTHVIIGESVA